MRHTTLIKRTIFFLGLMVLIFLSGCSEESLKVKVITEMNGPFKGTTFIYTNIRIEDLDKVDFLKDLEQEYGQLKTDSVYYENYLSIIQFSYTGSPPFSTGGNVIHTGKEYVFKEKISIPDKVWEYVDEIKYCVKIPQPIRTTNGQISQQKIHYGEGKSKLVNIPCWSPDKLKKNIIEIVLDWNCTKNLECENNKFCNYEKKSCEKLSCSRLFLKPVNHKCEFDVKKMGINSFLILSLFILLIVFFMRGKKK